MLAMEMHCSHSPKEGAVKAFKKSRQRNPGNEKAKMIFKKADKGGFI